MPAPLRFHRIVGVLVFCWFFSEQLKSPKLDEMFLACLEVQDAAVRFGRIGRLRLRCVTLCMYRSTRLAVYNTIG